MLISALSVDRSPDCLALFFSIPVTFRAEPGRVSCGLRQDAEDGASLLYIDYWRKIGRLEGHLRSPWYERLLKGDGGLGASSTPSVRGSRSQGSPISRSGWSKTRTAVRTCSRNRLVQLAQISNFLPQRRGSGRGWLRRSIATRTTVRHREVARVGNPGCYESVRSKKDVIGDRMDALIDSRTLGPALVLYEPNCGQALKTGSTSPEG